MKKLLLAIGLSLGLLTPVLAVNPSTQPGNAAYTMTSTDTFVITTTAFSAARTWTMPFAAGTCIGQNCQPFNTVLRVCDIAGTITATNTLTLARASGDTLNGNAADIVISAPYACATAFPMSANNWFVSVVGDYQSTDVASASAVALTSTTAANIRSLALSQGVWFCNGAITRKLAAATSVTQLKTSIFTTTATSGSLDTGTMVQWSTAANVMGADTTQIIGPLRFAPAASTTYYLVAQDTFTVDTNAGYGQLNCRRER